MGQGSGGRVVARDTRAPSPAAGATSARDDMSRRAAACGLRRALCKAWRSRANEGSAGLIPIRRLPHWTARPSAGTDTTTEPAAADWPNLTASAASEAASTQSCSQSGKMRRGQSPSSPCWCCLARLLLVGSAPSSCD
eukprot:scaffold2667_cov215-Prasinococcus_capsulatus_cf.AAC.1